MLLFEEDAFMYVPKYYKTLSQNQIAESIQKDGFDPVYFNTPPGYIYSSHEHPETKLLAYLAGSMKVKVGGNTFECLARDKLLIPGNTLHSAIVGPEGCEFFWSEKLV